MEERKIMIYCVEDERNIRELLVYTLRSTGFEAKGLENGEELFRELGEDRPELILLDIMMPGEDGYTILEKLKRMPEIREIPVIMLTAKGAEFDKVRGLDLGADDYITKPFGMMEFVSRVKAVLRRRAPKSQEELVHGPIELRISRHEVMEHGRKVELTLKEFELLRYLMENKGIVLSRDQLLTRIWGYDFDGETRTVDVHVRTLRQKLGAAGCCVETVRGVGYRMGDEQ
jgi:two-component system alkaline phosphatase synthesis response regulator PhoP